MVAPNKILPNLNIIPIVDDDDDNTDNVCNNDNDGGAMTMPVRIMNDVINDINSNKIIIIATIQIFNAYQ